MAVSYQCFFPREIEQVKICFHFCMEALCPRFGDPCPSLFVNVAIMHECSAFIAVWCLTLFLYFLKVLYLVAG